MFSMQQLATQPIRSVSTKTLTVGWLGVMIWAGKSPFSQRPRGNFSLYFLALSLPAEMQTFDDMINRLREHALSLRHLLTPRSQTPNPHPRLSDATLGFHSQPDPQMPALHRPLDSMSDLSTPPTSPRRAAPTFDNEEFSQPEALGLVTSLLEAIEDLAAPDLAPTGILEVVDKAFRDGPASRELAGHVMACLDANRLCARLTDRQDVMQGVAEEAFEAGLSSSRADVDVDKTDASDVDRPASIATPGASVPPKTTGKHKTRVIQVRRLPREPKTKKQRKLPETPDTPETSAQVLAELPVAPKAKKQKEMTSATQVNTAAPQKPKHFSPLELIVAVSPALSTYVHAHKVNGAIACVEAVSDYNDMVSKYRFIGVVDGRLYGVWRESWSPMLQHNQVYLDRSGAMRLTVLRRGVTGERSDALIALEKGMSSAWSKADIYAVIFALGFSPDGRGPTLILSKRFGSLNPIVPGTRRFRDFRVQLFANRALAERECSSSLDFLLTVSCSEKAAEAWMDAQELAVA